MNRGGGRFAVGAAVAAALILVAAGLWSLVLPRARDGAAGTGTAAAGGSATSSPTTPFRTLPPGSALPGDAACAAAVVRTPETVPANATFNGTSGGQRLPADFFAAGSGDTAAQARIAARVTGAFTGTTDEVLQWVACKWGIDERIVRAQAAVESGQRQAMLGDWSADAAHCPPGHPPGVDGRRGRCPESFGLLQVRYPFFSAAFPAAERSSAFNVDTAYAVWRACYDGDETWLSKYAAPGYTYRAGSEWGCLGRWFSGAWYSDQAQQYIARVQQRMYGLKPSP